MWLWESAAVWLWESAAVWLWESAAVWLWESAAVWLWESAAVWLWESAAVWLWESAAVWLWESAAVWLWESAAVWLWERAALWLWERAALWLWVWKWDYQQVKATNRYGILKESPYQRRPIRSWFYSSYRTTLSQIQQDSVKARGNCPLHTPSACQLSAPGQLHAPRDCWGRKASPAAARSLSGSRLCQPGVRLSDYLEPLDHQPARVPRGSAGASEVQSSCTA